MDLFAQKVASACYAVTTVVYSSYGEQSQYVLYTTDPTLSKVTRRRTIERLLLFSIIGCCCPCCAKSENYDKIMKSKQAASRFTDLFRAVDGEEKEQEQKLLSNTESYQRYGSLH